MTLPTASHPWKLALTLALSAFLIAFFQKSHAQSNGMSWNPNVKHARVGVGWFEPSLEFWDQNQFIREWSDRPGGSATFSAGASFDMGLPVELHLTAGFWRDRAKQRGVATIDALGTQSFTIVMIPFTLGASHSIDALSRWKVTPLVEAGGSLRWIRQEYSFEPTTVDASSVNQSDSGWGRTAHLSVGARRPLIGQTVQLNVGYVFGAYRTTVPDDDGGSTARSVSLSGPRVGVTVLLSR